MPASNATSAPALPARKPREDEIDAYGVTHTGKVRKDNQDHFLLCSLRKQLVVRLSSIPDADGLLGETERLASLAMVADGVGGAARGETASRVALAAVTTRLLKSLHQAASTTRCGMAPTSATPSSSAAEKKTRTIAAWPRRSHSTSASGPRPTCCRWATAAAIYSGTGS